MEHSAAKGNLIFTENEARNSDGWLRLAQSVIVQACLDASAGDSGAVYWLKNLDERDPWACMSELDCRLIREWARSGCKNANVKKSKKNSPGTTPRKTKKENNLRARPS